jgi:hypothetical protein
MVGHYSLDYAPTPEYDFSKFTNAATGQEVELICRGSFLRRDAEVRLGDKDGPILAHVAGQFSTIEIGGFTMNLGPHEYNLLVAPGGKLSVQWYIEWKLIGFQLTLRSSLRLLLLLMRWIESTKNNIPPRVYHILWPTFTIACLS